MPVIVTVADFDAAAKELALRFERARPMLPLLRIEGFCGVGKTHIARRVASLLNGIHVESDKYADKYDDPPTYPRCIRQHELDVAIKSALMNGPPVVLDAVCLAEIAPVDKWGRGIAAYVKQLSFSIPGTPIWHDGFWLDDDPPRLEPSKSVHAYHLKARPHEIADWIIEVPQRFHTLPTDTFSRDLCLDPPNGTVSAPLKSE